MILIALKSIFNILGWKSGLKVILGFDLSHFAG